MEESVKELLLFLNPVNRRRYAITDKNPEFERNYTQFTHQLDAIIASHTKPNEEEYITGLIGLLTRLRLIKWQMLGTVRANWKLQNKRRSVAKTGVFQRVHLVYFVFL